MKMRVDEQHEENQQQRQTQDQLAEVMRAALKGGERSPVAQGFGDLSQGGVSPSPAGEHPSRAADDRGSHKHSVSSTAHSGFLLGDVTWAFLYWVGFTGQQRLIDEEIFRLQHPPVSRHEATSGQQDDITGD